MSATADLFCIRVLQPQLVQHKGISGEVGPAQVAQQLPPLIEHALQPPAAAHDQ